MKFNEWTEKLDDIVLSLKPYSLFPREKNCVGECWEFKHNTNPMVGIAIEIDNTLSKYFLGSLAAAAMAGRWGIVVVPSCNEANKWVEVVNRMMSKGYEGRSPIPSIILVFDRQTLSEQIIATREQMSYPSHTKEYSPIPPQSAQTQVAYSSWGW